MPVNQTTLSALYDDYINLRMSLDEHNIRVEREYERARIEDEVIAIRTGVVVTGVNQSQGTVTLRNQLQPGIQGRTATAVYLDELQQSQSQASQLAGGITYVGNGGNAYYSQSVIMPTFDWSTVSVGSGSNGMSTPDREPIFKYKVGERVKVIINEENSNYVDEDDEDAGLEYQEIDGYVAIITDLPTRVGRRYGIKVEGVEFDLYEKQLDKYVGKSHLPGWF